MGVTLWITTPGIFIDWNANAAMRAGWHTSVAAASTWATWTTEPIIIQPTTGSSDAVVDGGILVVDGGQQVISS